MAPSPAAKRGATRIKRYKTEVKVTHKGGLIIVELSENFDMKLVPEGNYRLERPTKLPFGDRLVLVVGLVRPGVPTAHIGVGEGH